MMGSIKMEAQKYVCAKQTNQLKVGFWHHHVGKYQTQSCKTRLNTPFSTSTIHQCTETGTQNSKS